MKSSVSKLEVCNHRVKKGKIKIVGEPTKPVINGDRSLKKPIINDNIHLKNEYVDEQLCANDQIIANRLLAYGPDVRDIRKFSFQPLERLETLSELLWIPIKKKPTSKTYLNATITKVPSKSWFAINDINQYGPLFETELTIEHDQYIPENEDEKVCPFPPYKKKGIPKKKKSKPVVDLDVSKKPCTYIIGRKIGDVYYGKICGQLAEKNDLCKSHINKKVKFEKGEYIEAKTCKHIITQASGKIDRKGMYCCNFTNDTVVTDAYCKGHVNQHYQEIFEPELYLDGNQKTDKRSFPVRFYANKEENFIWANVFGCDRFTYNGAVDDNFNGTVTEGRDQYVSKESNFIDDNDHMIKNGFAITVQKEYTTLSPEKNTFQQIKIIKNVQQFVYPIIKNDSRYLNEHIILGRFPCTEMTIDDIENATIENFKLVKKIVEKSLMLYPLMPTSTFVGKNPFLLKCPKEIRANAVKSYVVGKNTAFDRYEAVMESNKWKEEQNKLMEKGERKYKIIKMSEPAMKHRTKKNAQHCEIDKENIKIIDGKLYAYVDMIGEIRLRSRNTRVDKKLMRVLKTSVNHNVHITKTKTGKYYVHFVIDEKIQTPQIDPNKIVADDVGGKTAHTCYAKNRVLEIGSKVDEFIQDALYKIDQNKSDLRAIEQELIHENDENKKIKLKELIKENRKNHKLMYEKLRNQINDMHYKAITKLLEYDVIYIPKLNVGQILRDKKYPRMQKRIMALLRHCKFIERLIYSAQIKGKLVYICSEHSTTQLCDKCFAENDCKFSRTYVCRQCGNVQDRDIHSAKLIYVRQVARIEVNGKIVKLRMMTY